MQHENHPNDIKKSVLLIVDDEESNQLLMKAYTSSLGIETVYFAHNGQRALEIVQSSMGFSSNTKNIDLILMDINMPVMDGHQSANAILKLNKTIPIIYQTANGTGFLNNLDKIGVMDHIQKPYNKKLIEDTINKYARNLVDYSDNKIEAKF